MRILIFFLVFISIFSCTDENIVVTRTKQEQLELDLTRIQGYINENNLSGFSSTDNGLFYKIVEVNENSNFENYWVKVKPTFFIPFRITWKKL